MSEDVLMTLDAFKSARQYWLEKLSGEIKEVRLPADFPADETYQPADYPFTFDNRLTGELRRLTGGNDLAMYTLLLAALKVLISVYTGQRDIIIASPVYAAQNREYNRYVPLRDVIEPKGTFKELLMAVKQTVTDGYRNEHYSIAHLNDLLGIGNGMSLMRVTALLESIHAKETVMGENDDFKKDIVLCAAPNGSAMEGRILYNSGLFEEDTIRRLVRCYLEILDFAVADVNVPLDRIPLMTDEEKQQVLVEFNRTAGPYPDLDKTMDQLFRSRAARWAGNTAVRSTIELKNIYDQLKPEKIDIEMTYQELDDRSDQLARRLIDGGLLPGEITALMVRHPLESVVAIWGILKAGGAYLPIDPGYPEKMKKFILEDSAVRRMVIEAELVDEVPQLAEPLTLIIVDEEDFDHENEAGAEVETNPRQPAYVIYTSGTSGRPKGVLIRHEGIVNFTLWRLETYGFCESDVTLQPLSYSFDGFGANFYSPLLSGGQLFMVPYTHKMDFQYTVEAVAAHHITNVSLVPGMYSALLDSSEKEQLESLRFVVLAGETASPALIKKSREKAPQVKLINEYGPTETTVTAAYNMHMDETNLTVVGKPIAGKQLYILDPALNPLPVKVTGELCIAGTGTALGYLNNPELTAEKFYQDFQDYHDDQDKKIKADNCLYRTGDMARWLPDGTVEFFGRIDQQVKIRGYRIELPEIENRLTAYDKIEAAVVLDRTDDAGNRFLCAYIVPRSPLTAENLEVTLLRDYLSEELPDYMIPAYFITLDHLPLTVNGKVDRRALPGLEGNLLEEKVEYVAPASAVEETLADIWQQVLERERIGTQDNFFMMGGDSIKAIQIASRMNKAGYKVEMRDIFQYPSITQLAPCVRESHREGRTEQSAVTGIVPLTAVQKWFFESSFVDPHHFNHAVLLYSREGFDLRLLEAVFSGVWTHHDALRTIFRKENGKIIQEVRDVDLPPAIQEYDLRAADVNGRKPAEILEEKINGMQTGIDLEKGPLVKLGLFHLEDGDRLLMVIHHLVTDGVSWRILFEDIETLYGLYRTGGMEARVELPSRTASFKAWAEAIHRYAQSETLLKEIPYWQRLEARAVPLPVLPDKDYPSGGNRVKDTGRIEFRLSPRDTRALLTRVNFAFGTRTEDILLTALGLAFKRCFGQERVLIEMEGHGREEGLTGLDISRTVGWFTAVYPVLLDFSKNSVEEKPGRCIVEVKEQLHNIPNRGTGYGILKYITPPEHKTALRFNLEPRIIFNYLGQFDSGQGESSGQFKKAPESAGALISGDARRLHELEFSAAAADNRFTMTLRFSKKQYKKQTMKRFLRDYETELRRLIDFCLSREESVLTPVDLSCPDISIDTLEHLRQGFPLEDIYPLTPMQEAMLFHHLYGKRGSKKVGDSDAAYFQQLAYRLSGPLDLALVEKSLNLLLRRHVVLRAAFVHEGLDRPVQVVLKQRQVEFTYEDLRERTWEEEEKRAFYIKTFKEKDRRRSFDLTHSPLVRLSVLQFEDEIYEFIWAYHHILMDGWSSGVLIAEYSEIYNAFLEGRENRLPAVTPYRTYIRWMLEQDKEKARVYWTGYLDGFEGLTGIPGTGNTGTSDGYQNRDEAIELDAGKTADLEQLAARLQVTLNTLVQAVWSVLLSRYAGKQDVVFGAVVSGRPPHITGMESMVGLFINTVPVRAICENDMPFDQLLNRLQADAAAAGYHHFYPLPDIQAATGLQDGLLDHLVVFENYPLSEQIDGVVKMEKQAVRDTTTGISNLEAFEQNNFDMNVIFSSRKGRLRIRFNYNGAKYETVIIRQIRGHVIRLLDLVLRQVELPVGQMDPLSDREKHHLLVELNDVEAGDEYTYEDTIHRLFERQVERTPDHTALAGIDAGGVKDLTDVIMPGTVPVTITYRELNKRVNQLAHQLRARGVGRDTIVAFLMESSVDMIVAILAVLKAGGAYLPLDPRYPADRITAILEDSGTSLLLTRSHIKDTFSYTALQGLPDMDIQPKRTAQRKSCDFDALPIPDRSLVDYEKYNRHIGLAMVKNSISMLGSRGCPYNCAYCHRVWPRKHVFRSAENIFSELKFYYDLGVRRFDLIDDVFNFNIENSSRFFKYIIDNKMKVQLFFPTGMRGDRLTKDYIDLMVEAGLVSLDLALETASPRLQEMIGKKLDIDKLRENVDYICRRYPQVILDLNIMYGFPTETEEEALTSLDFIKNTHWLHFPYVFILKIHPKTNMGKLALDNGVSPEAIARSMNYSYHDIPETLPFSGRFARQLTSRFMSDYFLSRERLLHVLPFQMKAVTEDELVKKYDNYLPMKINDFGDILKAGGISREELGDAAFSTEDYCFPPDFASKVKRHFRAERVEPEPDPFRLLLIDLSEMFSTREQNILHGEIVVPYGVMSLMTYLNKVFGSRVSGKIVKSVIDFDDFEQLITLVKGFRPHLIGIRSLSYYKDFFHESTAQLRQWGIDVPIVAGGPYATMDYELLLRDPHVDLAVLGEGEDTLAELVEKMMNNGGKLPGEDVLDGIAGIAYIKAADKPVIQRRCRAVVSLDDMSRSWAHYPGDNPEHINQPRDLLYLISTSGSTGKPKSVMLEHRNMVNLVNFGFTRTGIDFSKVLQFSAVAFDASAHEIFSSLLSGGTLYLMDGRVKADVPKLLEFIDAHRVTTLFMPPALLKLIFSEPQYVRAFPRSVEHIIAAGEQLVVNEPLRNYLRERGMHLHNHYGPSETHVVTALAIDPAGLIEQFPSIGTPISNTRIYILDEQKRLKPLGAAGELYIGGANVGRGYLNRPELTAERFTPLPLLTSAGTPGLSTPLYRTGDRARLLPDGTIVFMGRMDEQVKVRGFRIELGEIEAALMELPGIREVVVANMEDEQGDPRLCAYIVTQRPMEVEELRERLSDRLPDYMIPSFFIPLERIPLSVNGKVNRRALPPPGLAGGETYSAPEGETEKLLAGIWAEVLGMEQALVSVESNFFEAGGHSLKATILAARIHKVFNVKIHLSQIFETPTIRELARFIKLAAVAAADMYASILPAERKNRYVLSPAQRRLYVLYQMDPQSLAYNMPQVTVMEGLVQPGQLEETFRKLIWRHESLRTSFFMENDQPVQQVHDDIGFSIRYYDALKTGEAVSLIKNFIRPFDLARAPLIRVGLAEMSENTHLLMIDMHHIITDGVSHNILVQDFTSLLKGEPLPGLRLHYKDYAVWLGKEEQRRMIARQETYWLNRFSGELPVLNLPVDYPRPAVQSMEGDHLWFEIAAPEVAALRNLAAQEGVTLYMVLLALFNVLLHKLTGQEDIIIGTPVANRRHDDLRGIIGMFVNTLALRNFPAAEKTFSEFLEEVGRGTLEAFENQDYAFEDLVEKVVTDRDMGREPLFNVMFTLQNMGFTGAEIPGVTLKPFSFEHRVSKFDFSLTAIEAGEALRINVEYCTRLFKEETVRRFMVYFAKIAAELPGHPEVKLADVGIITEEEKQKILHVFNDTETDFPGIPVLRLFEEQTEKSPDGIAVVAHKTNTTHKTYMTYKQLNTGAGRLACQLREEGVQSGDIVGIKMERSPEMIMAALAAWKAGAAYMPVDPAYPPERIDFMLADSKTKVLVTAETFSGLETPSAVDAVSVGSVVPGDVAYVIYTSGSTGRPKGVMVEHGALSNRLYWEQGVFPQAESDVLFMQHSFSFDASVNELFLGFLSGACVCLPPTGGDTDPRMITDIIETCNVTFIQMVPSLLNILLDYLEETGRASALSSLKYFNAGGEAVNTEVVAKFNRLLYREGRLVLNNSYGPTEATIDVLRFDCLPGLCDFIVPIGKPIANTRVYILDKRMRLQPVGVPGELYIAGLNLARGYLNRPELTAEKFINKSFMGVQGAVFQKSPLAAGGNLYNTGDLASWLPDGNVRFLGRADQQVKIRGFRVEPGEVEERLLSHPAVKEAAVTARGTGSRESYLCAYVVMQEEADLEEYLLRHLPAFMVPAHFVKLERFPVTPAGKVDRNALPAPVISESAEREESYTAPRDELEKNLEKIWAEVLELDRGVSVGIDAGFFRLGGHSLKATVLAVRVQRELSVKVPLAEIFKRPTIRELARYIRKASGVKFTAVMPGEKKEYYAVSSVQRRLYVVQQMDPDSTGYNIPQFSRLAGRQDRDKLEQVFHRLIERHESLRTSFIVVEDEPVQVIHEQVDFAIRYFEEGGKEQEIIKNFIRPFDLSEAPLMRVGLLKQEEERYLLMVDMHHIISDGVSHRLLEQDFAALSAGEELPPLRLQYRDYAEWEHRQGQDRRIAAAREAFWMKLYEEEVPLIDLPLDFPRPVVRDFSGRTIVCELGQAETSGLKALALEHDATLFMVLQGLFSVLFARLCRQEDIVLGTAVANRNHPDLQQIIGMFVNTLALRNRPVGDITFVSFLEGVRDMCLQAFEYQDYPFEELVEKLGDKVTRDPARNPLFDVMMGLHENALNAPASSERQHQYEEVNTASKFDLNWQVSDRGDMLLVRVQYMTALFKEETVRRFIEYFKTVVSTVLEDSRCLLAEIGIVSDREKQRIINEFNDTSHDYPHELTIQQLFEEQVDKSPHGIAVVAHTTHKTYMTYKELSTSASRLACLLRDRGVGPGSIVGIKLEPSLELPAAILGVLKTGAAYLPMDPRQPEELIRYMLADSGAKELVTENTFAESGKQPALSQQPVDSGCPAYVIYTSGTTGKSKGVMVTHRNLINYVHWFIPTGGIGREDRTVLSSSFAFDLGYTVIYSALLSGCPLHMIPRDMYLSPEEFTTFLFEERITYVKFTPSLFGTITDSPYLTPERFRYLRLMLLGGEAIKLKDVETLHAVCPHVQVMNHYGPTETTIGSVARFIDFENFEEYKAHPAIGKPIHNTRIYILDAYFNVQPVGIAGELCIAGDGTARGYLNRPELTAQKFINKSFWESRTLFSKRVLAAGGNIYRTGDLARWLPDGTIEFLGRIDTQVKIRGYRVELGEINQRLTAHPLVEEAAVITRGNNDPGKNLYICAYVVPRQESEDKPLPVCKEFRLPEPAEEVVRRFETTVSGSPGAVAVQIGEDNYITYDGLLQGADLLARQIEQKYDDRYRLSKQERIRYSRQMLLDGWGIEAQEKLKSTTVFVAGAGGGASPTIAQLALAGFGTIVVCDYDDVELSNLNRQFLHDESRIGMKKALSARMTVNNLNPHVRMIPVIEQLTRENVFELVGDAQVIFDMLDDMEGKFILSECAVALGIPHIVSAMADIDSYAAVFHYPHTPCFHCLYDRDKYVDISSVIDSSKSYEKKPLHVLASSLFTATGFAVTEAVKIVLGFENPAYNKFFLFNQKGSSGISRTDGYNMMIYPFSSHFREISLQQGFDWDTGWRGQFVEQLTITPDPRCPLCGSAREKRSDYKRAVPVHSHGFNAGEDAEEYPTVALLLGRGDNGGYWPKALLAVLNAGKVSVPMDPGASLEQSAYILEDSGARLIITSGEHMETARRIRDEVNKGIPIINLDALETPSAPGPETVAKRTADVTALFYSYPAPEWAGVEEQEDGFHDDLAAMLNALCEAGGGLLPKIHPASGTRDYYTLSQLREYLQDKLPEYMVPAHIVMLEKMPMTANGKLDTRALPEPGMGREAGTYQAPRGLKEKKLAEIWAEVLGVPEKSIGIDDDFFRLGGHSIKATQLLSRMHKELNVKLPLADIFRSPTIRGLAGCVEKAAVHRFTAIEPVEKRDYYFLSSAQKRFYFLQQMEPQSTAYNVPQFFILEGEIDLARLESAFRKLIGRHESLRTSFHMKDAVPVQRVHDETGFEISLLPESDAEIEKIARSFVRSFDLSQAPLLRAALLKTGENRHLLMTDWHHIISDGVSRRIMTGDFWSYYLGRELRPLKLHYKDYSQWQNSETGREALRSQEEFWLRQFEEEVPVLNLPVDFPRPPLQSFEGGVYTFEIDAPRVEALKKMAMDEGGTLFSVLLALYNVLLSRLSGLEDIVVGTLLAGRRHADLEGIIGAFLKTLALRNYPGAERTFREFLGETAFRTLEAFENQDYNYEDLVDKVVKNRDTGRNPLHDVMLILQNFAEMTEPDQEEAQADQSGDLVLKPYSFEIRTAVNDMTWYVGETGGKLVTAVRYCVRLFKEETIRRFASYFSNICDAVLQNPDIKIGDITILSESEKHLILEEFNNTDAPFPENKTIHQLFEEQVEKSPHRIAITADMTYKELNVKADRLACLLQEKGIGPGSIVGIRMERSVEMIIGIFAVLKCGAVYMPIDPRQPDERTRFMSEDSGAAMIITAGTFSEVPAAYATQPVPIEPEAPAYIIYTSGSTGRPKGVMVSHRSLVNRLKWMQKQYPIGEWDVLIQKTTVTFDVSLWELFWWSFEGAALCLPEPGAEKDPEMLVHAMETHKVTVVHFVPSMLEHFLEYVEAKGKAGCLSSLKQVIVSGEELKKSQADRFHRLLYSPNGTRLSNLYGPTEAAVDVSYYDCIEGCVPDRVPIGKPIANVRLYILDARGGVVPLGVTGELCIAGVCLAEGYLNRPELTSEKFINKSFTGSRGGFSKEPLAAGGNLYRTGDLARWLPDGTIEFLGRKDFQVKIRGFRIELGEIENQLLLHPTVKEAVVIKVDDYLCAYVAGDLGNTGIAQLKEWLAQRLPGYMVPAHFVLLERLPLTSSGKMNRRALPKPGAATVSAVTPPRNEIEEKLVEIWAAVLGMDAAAIGIDTSFFELGGHSLGVITVVAEIFKTFGVEMSVVYFFKIPRIREVGEYIAARRSGATLPEAPAAEDESVVLLTGKYGQNLFLFPPIIGYGIGYKGLARRIQGYSVYAFNYIEEKNRLSRYADIITNIQPEGPYLLAGYSAGGNLAFETALELEKRGFPVDRVIIIDALCKDMTFTHTSGEENNNFQKAVGEAMEAMGAAFLKDQVMEKSRQYSLYYRQLVHMEKVNADIHFIFGADKDERERMITEVETGDANSRRFPGWDTLTRGIFETHEGFGIHTEMFSPGNLEKNAELLNRLLTASADKNKLKA